MLLMFIKRTVPFALTLVLGIFIASFFITLTMPQIKFGHRYEYRNKCRQNKMAEREERIRRELQNLEFQELNESVPPPPLAPAIEFEADYAPAPPTVPRNRR